MAENPQKQSSPNQQANSASFDGLFRKLAVSTILKSIWREVYAEEYPEAANPFSFVTMTDLKQLISILGIGSEASFVDIGCGQGGLSIWVAEKTGASVLGLDFSNVAVGNAAAKAKAMGFGDRATFIKADAASPPLRDACFDGAMSTDVLQLTPDPAAVIAEVSRILNDNAKFAFTTWCIHKPIPGRAVILDYRPILERAGFEVELYYEPANWREQQGAIYRQIREQADALRSELGEEISAALLTEATERPQQFADLSRVLVGARKKVT
jgi:ubiquinone/menaquinone biosynthesis C-methylase UbiE